MSGYVWALAPCWACGRVFGFNPELVPSVPIDPSTNRPPDLGGDASQAVRQPVCESCVERANEHRLANDLPVIRVLAGAYEPTEAS